MISTSPSTIAQSATQSYIRQRTGTCQSLEVITAFSDRARKVQPILTDRAAVVLYVASKIDDGVTVSDLEVAIQAKPSVIYATLRGLSDLGLIEVTRDGDWTRTVTLTGAGQQFVGRCL